MLQFKDTLNIYPSPLYQVLNINWSAFVKGILLTLQSHGWSNGTHGGHQLGSGDLYLLGYVAHCCVIGHCVDIMAAHGVSQGVVLPTSHPTHPSLSHPTPPHHPPPLLSILTAEKGGKKYHEIQPSEIEEVSYNKSQ